MRQKGKGPGDGGRLLALALVNEVFAPKPATAGRLNSSGATEADGHLLAFHQHRHPAIARSEAFHLFHGLGTGDDIPIDDGQSLFALGLPGLAGKGSGLLAEDGNLLGHLPPPQD
jgi:hypothetical protein